MRALLFLSGLLLLASGGWLAFERRAADLAWEGLRRLGLEDVLQGDAVRIEPGARRIVIQGGRLRDPVGGEIVAQVEEVVVQFPLGWRGAWDGMPTSLHGRGGRAVLRWDERGEDLTLVTAIDGLIDRILALFPLDAAPGAPGAPSSSAAPAAADDLLFPITFEDLDVVVSVPNQPLERLSGVSVEIRDHLDVVEVTIQAGSGQGAITLAFDRHGFQRFGARAMRATPALLGLVPEVGWFLSEALVPRGLVDVDVTSDGELFVEGRLRETFFASPYIPFPLGPAEAAFRVVGDRLFVEEADVGLSDGRVRVAIEGPLDALEVRLDVRHAGFHETLLGLIPAYGRSGRLSRRDGGAFELDLLLRANLMDPEAPLGLEGQGGFHVESAELDVSGASPLVFTDAVGRFRIAGGTLEVPEVSARVAGGSLRAAGRIDLETDAYSAVLRVQDADVARLHTAFHAGCRCEHRIAGWVQGELDLTGVLGRPGLPSGRGQASVRAGDLWESPLIEAILLALPEPSGVARASQRVELAFSLEKNRILFERARLTSDLLTLTAEGGSLDVDGNLRLRGRVFQLPFGAAGKVVEYLTQKLLLEIQIDGTLSDPIVTPLPVPVVTGPLRAFVRGVVGLFSSGEEEPAAPSADG